MLQERIIGVTRIINRSKTRCRSGPQIIIVRHSKQFPWPFPDVLAGVKRKFEISLCMYCILILYTVIIFFSARLNRIINTSGNKTPLQYNIIKHL